MQIQVAGLWEKKGKKKDGSDYRFLAGNVGYIQIPPGANLVVQKNLRKESDKHPDYFVLVEEPYQKQPSYSFPANSPSPSDGGSSHSLEDIPF